MGIPSVFGSAGIPKVMLALRKYKIRRIFAHKFASFATTTSQVFAWGDKYE